MENYSLRKFSLSEFNKLKNDDENIYELIDGIVLMSPRPNIKHQGVMSNLHFELRTCLRGKSCRVFTEIELQFEENILIPDISVICGLENTDIQRYKKAPEIVIEILSPSSKYTDTFTKLIKYQLFGIKEYWIVNSETRTINIYNFEKKTNIEYSGSDELTSGIFNGLEINVSNIFM